MLNGCCAVPVCHGDLCHGAEHASHHMRLHLHAQMGRRVQQARSSPNDLQHDSHLVVMRVYNAQRLLYHALARCLLVCYILASMMVTMR